MQQSLSYYTRAQENGQPVPAEKLRKVFISYKKTDDPLGDKKTAIIKEILDCMDVAIWNDAKLTPGLDYDDEIKKAIEECDAVVLLLSEHILESEYVWDKEVAVAKTLEKGIIPICMGLSRENLQIADQRLQHRHCLVWPMQDDGQLDRPDENLRDTLKRALTAHVLDVDLVDRIQQFFAAGKHQVSLRYLSYEQIYYMGCGYLSGIGTVKNNDLSIPLLKSVLRGYGNDPEFVELKKIVSGKLFYHYMESNNETEISKYAILGMEYGNYSVINEINTLYNEDQRRGMLLDPSLRNAFYHAIKKYGLREGFTAIKNPRVHTEKLAVQKVEPTECNKAEIWVDGHVFYLTAKKNPKKFSGYGDYKREEETYYTLYLMRDDVAIDAYPCYLSPGPGNALFLNYDPQLRVLQVLESSFEYREVATDYIEYTYTNVFGDEIERQAVYCGWHKYASLLPYWTRKWDKSPKGGDYRGWFSSAKSEKKNG